MTPSETCRAISELLEPKPTEKPWELDGVKCHMSYTWEGAETPRRCWLWTRDGWRSLDWHSPAEMCRLLAVIPMWTLWKRHDGYYCSADRLPCHNARQDSGEAVALAALAYLQSLPPADLEAVRERLGEGL